MKNYPSFNLDRPQDVNSLLHFVVKERRNDVLDWINLPQQYLSGRKVNKIPASSADVDPATDRVGDMNYTTTYLYILVDNSGVAVWRRVALGAW